MFLIAVPQLDLEAIRIMLERWWDSSRRTTKSIVFNPSAAEHSLIKTWFLIMWEMRLRVISFPVRFDYLLFHVTSTVFCMRRRGVFKRTAARVQIEMIHCRPEYVSMVRCTELNFGDIHIDRFTIPAGVFSTRSSTRISCCKNYSYMRIAQLHASQLVHNWLVVAIAEKW